MKTPEQLAEERFNLDDVPRKEGGSYYKVVCDNCGWFGPSSECGGGLPTGGYDFTDIECPVCEQVPDEPTQRDLLVARFAYAACLREGAQGIVKEGPSVEDIMEVVKGSDAWDTLLQSPHRIVEMDYYENDLRTRLSALFTQTQVGPVADVIVRDLAEWSKRYPRSTIYSHHRKERIDGELQQIEERAKAYSAQGIEVESPERVPERGLGTDSPVAEERSDAPKNNVEQSEDAALPDGRWLYAPVTDEDVHRHALTFAAHQLPDGDVDFAEYDYETFIRALKYISESTNLFRAPPTN